MHRLVPLRSLLMVAVAAGSSIAAGGTFLPSLMADALHRNQGSFVLTVNPSSVTLRQGTSAISTITVFSVNSFSGAVTLSATLANSTLSVSFGNSTLNVPSSGTVTSTLTLTVASTALTGSYNLIITGTGTGSKRNISSSSMVSILVTSMADFNISSNPAVIINTAGLTNSTSIALTSIDGFSGTVTLTATTPFGFLGVMGGQNPVSLSGGGTASSTLMITTMQQTLPGVYNVIVTGTSGERSHFVAIPVTVVDPIGEALVIVGFNFNSATNLTLYLQNTGNTTVTLAQYKAEDTRGDAWTLNSWQGPTGAANTLMAANVLISTSCIQCSYTGIFGLFPEFMVGQTYTITVTTTMGNQFTYRVTR